MKKSEAINSLRERFEYINLIRAKELLTFVVDELGLGEPFLCYEEVVPEGMYLTEDIREEIKYGWEAE